MIVVFRCDASVAIGTGHLARCLTLADFLKDSGVKSHFVTRQIDVNVDNVVTARGHSFSILQPSESEYSWMEDDPYYARHLGATWEEDASQVSSIMHPLRPDWLVVDNYALDSRWYDNVRGGAVKILAIDDLADRDLSCDLLLDQTYGRKDSDYRARVNSDCTLLLGSKYALLKPEFRAARAAGDKRQKQCTGISQLLLFLGGTDPSDITSRVLTSIKEIAFDTELHVDVVMGSGAPNLDAVRRIADEHPLDVTVSVDVDNMAERMVAADIAIGAAGTTTWERCCVGLPTILISTVRNQELIAANVAATGAAFSVSLDEVENGATIPQLLERLHANPDVLQRVAQRCLDLVDGRGCSRVVTAMGL